MAIMDASLLLFSSSYRNMSTFTVASALLISGLYYGFNIAAAYVNRPRFKTHPTWQVKKVFRYKQYDKLIQKHTQTIQLWLLNSGSENLSAFESQRKAPTCKKNFCQSILIQLLDPSRSQHLKDMLNFVHEDSQECQALAEALAYIIVVALEIPMKYAGTFEAFKTLLCKSNDSFLFDFILINLKKHTKSLAIKTGNHPEFDQYTSFLESPTPCRNRWDVLFSKLPLVGYLLTSYKIFKATDMTPALFRCFVQRTELETDRIRAEYLKIPSLAPMDPLVLAHNKNYCDLKNFKVTPMNISYTYMRTYKTHYTNLQTQLGQLKSGLDFCKDLQVCKPVASSPLISTHLAKVKQVYLSIFQLFRKEEEALFQFEKAFIIARLCSNDIICIQGMRQRFSGLAFIGRRRLIEGHELDKLNKVAYKNMQLILNLEKAFELSSNSICSKFKSLCQSRIDEVKRECEEYVVMYNEIKNTWTSLKPVIYSIKECLEPTEQKNATLKKQSYDVVFSSFSIFLYNNDLELLQPFQNWHVFLPQNKNDSKNQIITKKIIQAMVNFASKQIYEINKDIMSEPKDS